MSISIVIVTYNSSTHITKLLSSINQQTGFSNKLEVVIVDNNSKDSNILKKILNENKKLTNIIIKSYFRKRNYGFAASCNYGFDRASNSCVLFINPDCRIINNSLILLYDHFLKQDIAIAGGLVRKTTQDNKQVHRTAYNKPSIKTLLFEFSNLGKLLNIQDQFYIKQKNIVTDTIVYGVSGAFMLVRGSAFREVGMFDEKYFMYLEDVDLCEKVHKSNWKILYCPHSVIEHIGGASSSNKYRINHISWFNSRNYFVWKNFPRALSLLMIFIYSIEKSLLIIRKKHV